jgi:hypothetical protein
LYYSTLNNIVGQSVTCKKPIEKRFDTISPLWFCVLNRFSGTHRFQKLFGDRAKRKPMPQETLPFASLALFSASGLTSIGRNPVNLASASALFASRLHLDSVL